MKRIFLIIVASFMILTYSATAEDNTDDLIIDYINSRNVTVLNELLKGKKIEINYKVNNSTILFIACELGKSNIAAALLENGAEVDSINKKYLTPLMVSSQKGYLNIVDILIKYKAEINMQTDDYKTTALMFASDKGHKDVVQLLIKNGADINIQNLNGGTALMIACMQGYADIAELLLKNGADVNAKDGYGNTAMSFAVKFEFKNIVLLLKKYGAKEED